MDRLAPLLIVILISACSAPGATPSASATVAVASPTQPPTPAATTAAPTATTAATASPTLIPLPNTAAIIAPSGTVVWTFVALTRLFRSTDRGDTWQERSIPPSGASSLAFAFADDREGWALMPGSPGTQCQGQPVALSHTTDGGATWQALAATGFAAPGCKDSVAFSDATHGYIGSHDPNTAPVIYRSTDGGRTWIPSKPLPDPPGFQTVAGVRSLGVGTVRAFGQTVLVEASANNPGTGGRYAFRSTDGGATWTYASTAPDRENVIAFVTATRWIQIGSPPGNSSPETTDGGASWHAFTTDYQQAAPVAPAITFGDAQVGYATVRGAIQRTVDGGAHWTTIRTPGTF
jgi:photosystem II stability/assembly factor-like uncharacterized protein